MLGAVAVGKVVAGPDAAFSAVALLPVAYVTWFISRRIGFVAAGASAAALFLTNALVLRRPSAIVDLWNASMDVAVFGVVVWSLSETKAQYMKARQLAREDPLTSLLNRRAFLEGLAVECRRARRYREPITVAYIDLDGFKRINDAAGHAAGDRCLIAVATVLRRVVREVDVIGRLGGDEFAVVLTRITADASKDVLSGIATSLRRIDTNACAHSSVSIGAVTFTHPDDDPEAMIGAADELLYLAKQSGKNRVVHREK